MPDPTLTPRPPDATLAPVLRAAAPYIHAHQGRIMVVAFSGSAIRHPDFDDLVHDLALLPSLGVRLVLVHGARPQIDDELARRGIQTPWVADHRITTGAALPAVVAAVGGLGLDLLARFTARHPRTPMAHADIKVVQGNWVVARAVGIRQGVDHQHTGDVRRVDAEQLRAQLDAGRVALIGPLAPAATGELHNLRYEDVATAVAAALGADKLVSLLDADPRTGPLARLADADGHLSDRAARRWRAAVALGVGQGAQTVPPADFRRLDAALAALDAGVKRVHLVGASLPGALLSELYTRDGAGLMLARDDDYEAIREARDEDLAGVLALVRPLERSGHLVPRPQERLEADLPHFSVMVRDGLVVACAALFPYPDAQAGELACVAVHPEFRSGGRARALLRHIEDRARALGLTRLFALTTATGGWFSEQGFLPARAGDLPPARRATYDARRASAVLVKLVPPRAEGPAEIPE